MTLKPEHLVPLPLITCLGYLRGTQQSCPQNPTWIPVRGSTQPTKGEAVEPRMPFLPP